MGRRERKGEKLPPKVRMRGMLEVGQERKQEVPECRRDTSGQGWEGRLAAPYVRWPPSEVYFSEAHR